MKKLPVIGFLIGAIAALFAFRKKKSPAEESDTNPSEG